MRTRHGAYYIPSANFLRLLQAYRYSILEDREEEARAAKDGLGRGPGSLKFVSRLRPLAAEDVLGADRHVVARMTDLSPSWELTGENLCAQCGAKRPVR